MTTTFGWLLDAVPRTSLRVEFTTGRHEVADSAVMLLIGEEGEEQTVRVYDGSHGVNELHRYNRRGQKQSAEVFHPGTLGEGMRFAIKQIEAGYEAMIESWQRT